MICKVFVFRHAETFDNYRGVFSGWRDSELTLKGVSQAQKIAEQLGQYQIDYAFTSHLRRAKKTMEIVLQTHPAVPVFIDDRLIERCYGLLQGKNKRKLAHENPEWQAQVHRGYAFAPPEGESIRMVEKRVISFLMHLREWLGQNSGNVAISCRNNSMRTIRRVLEHLSIEEMLELEAPQGSAAVYELDWYDSSVGHLGELVSKPRWKGIVVSRRVKMATDPSNPLRLYYC